MKRLLVIVSFCLVAASCTDRHTVVSNPVAPSPPIAEAPPTSPLYPPESWTLTSSVTSVTPHRCFRDVSGLTQHFALVVYRAEAMRAAVYWDPTDGIQYAGTLSGEDFSLAGDFNGGNLFSLGCLAGGQVQVMLTGRVSGRFSGDSRSLSAEEVLSYRVAGTGEQVDVRSRWIGIAP